jgi:hypothetical protein
MPIFMVIMLDMLGIISYIYSMSDQYHYTIIHDFKTHFSRYLRLMHNGTYDGVVVKQYKKPMALIVPLVHPDKKKNEKDKIISELSLL